MDRLLDEAREGPLYLRRPAIADMIVEAIQYNADVLGHYALHAFVVMPNHVHLLATPVMPLPKLTKSLKGITAKRANAMLALTGNPFWQGRPLTARCGMHRSLRRSETTSKGTPCGRDW